MSKSILSYDPSNLLQPAGILPANALHAWKERLEEARDHIIQLRKSGEQGFLDLPFDAAMVKRVQAMAAKTKRFDTLLVLGIGGSDLGARAILQALPSKRRVLFAGANTDPDELAEILSQVNWKKTLVNIISKSGDTVEPTSAFLVAWDLLKKRVGKNFAKHIIATTDAERGTLVDWAEKEGYARLLVPENVGGRFSVLSDVGLFPAAWAGVKIKELLAGAASMVRNFEHASFDQQPAAVYAALHAEAYLKQNRSIFILMPYAARLQAFAFWYRQIIAESLGKTSEIGPTPIAAFGATDQHSQLQLYMEGPEDKVVTFIEVQKFATKLRVPKMPMASASLAGLEGKTFQDLIHAERRFTAEALTQARRPNGTFFLPKLDAHGLGQLFQTFMIATAYLGELLNVDAYDQPGVEDGKRRFREWLSR